MTQDNQDEPLFPPFEPSPTTAPAAATVQQPPKRERKAASDKTAKKSKAPKPTKKAAPAAPASAEPPARTRRKRRVALPPGSRPSRGLKLPVNTILTATAKLKASDAAVFEKVLGILSGAAKGQRNRVLDALGKVFA